MQYNATVNYRLFNKIHALTHLTLLSTFF